MRFERMGAFEYSHEENTHAYNLEDDVPEDVKMQRANEIMEIQSTAELRRQKNDGDLSAQILGAGYLAQWNEFLDSRGLRR